MKDNGSIPAMGASILSEVTLVDRIERRQAGPFRSRSLPGHLIHVCTAGEVEQRSGGVTQHFQAGDAIWYWGNEPVQGRVLQAPWEFYTVNFQAHLLQPPPLNQRVRPVPAGTIDRMDRLLAVWRDLDLPGLHRHLRVHAQLLEIIDELLPREGQCQRIDDPTQLWWGLETRLRNRLDLPIDLDLLVELSGRSQRSIARACRLATGMSPIKRVKQIRLSWARGLVQLSDLTITEIARRVGYGRVQEFSRDYRNCFGRTPSQDRHTGPDYRRRETPDEQGRR